MMMMMMTRSNPTVHIAPDPFSFDDIEMSAADEEMYDDDVPSDPIFSTDHFRMYEFKIRRCSRGRPHDWTDCPFAHHGEKARRRNPRKVHYSGDPCPEFRKGNCSKADKCEYSHGVFECWLHPCRYRTKPCKDGVQCRCRICFFAHTHDQLRVLPLSQLGPTQPESYDGSPSRFTSLVSSPISTLYTSSYSPPISPVSSMDVNELASFVHNMQIGNESPRMSVRTDFGSPRNPSMLRPAFGSSPETPTSNLTYVNLFDQWGEEEEEEEEEEPIMERVESGRDIRAKIYAKLSRENSLD